MIRPILVLSVLWVVGAGGIAFAAEQAVGDAAADTSADNTCIVVRSDLSEEDEALEGVPIHPVGGSFNHEYRDARWIGVAQDAEADIAAVVAEIDNLDSREDEPALQREIENIKLEAEISRLMILLEDAEQQSDNDRVDTLRAEIEHLSGIDEPVAGIPQGQPTR